MADWKSNPCFYVSVIDGNRTGVLAGPFPTHGLALDLVDRARDLAVEIDPKAHFYSFGTCRVRHEHKPAGLLNDQVGYDELIKAWEKQNLRTQAWMADELKKERESNVQSS